MFNPMTNQVKADKQVYIYIYILYKLANVCQHCFQMQNKRHSTMQLLWVWISSNSLGAIWQFVSRLLKMIITLIKTSFLETYSGYLSRNVEKSVCALKYYHDINKSLLVII